MIARIRDYILDGHYLEAVHHPTHGPLMTRSLRKKITWAEYSIVFAGILLGFVFGAWAGFTGLLSTETHIVTGQVVDALGFVYPFQLEISDALASGVPFAVGGLFLSRLTRAYIVHRTFNKEWAERSFFIPVVRV